MLCKQAPYSEQVIIDNLKMIANGNLVAVFLQPKNGRPAIGYFDDYGKLAEMLKQCDGWCNVFYGINVLSEEKLNRIKMKINRFVCAGKGDSVTNNDISAFRWFLVDVDAIRVKGYEHSASTDAEKNKARATMQEVKRWLTEQYGWPESIVGDSGNGYHLLFKINFPNDESTRELIKRAAEILSENFPGVDKSVCTPSHYDKLYGTIAVKGDNTADRPYRRSAILEIPAEVKELTIAQIKVMCDDNPPPSAPQSTPSKSKITLKEFYKEYRKRIEPFVSKQNGNSYVTVYNGNGGIVSTYNIKGSMFQNQFRTDFRNASGGEPCDSSKLQRYLDDLSSIAYCEGSDEKSTYTRVGTTGSTIYYNVCDKKNVVVIDEKGWQLQQWEQITDKNIKMISGNLMSKQVIPASTPSEKGLFELVSPFFNVSDEDKILLLITVLVWIAAPSIPKPILNFYGEPGTGKTTLTTIIQKIVDPSCTLPSFLPKDIKDIVVQLNCRYLIAFDNLTDITEPMSDLFCQVCTGGAFVSRQYYTNDEVNVMSFNNALILNGLSGNYGKIDLQDRMIRVCLLPHENGAKTLKEIMGKFSEVLPQILGQAFTIISKAIIILPTIKLEGSSRMSDFEQHGAAISQVLFGDEQVFLKAFRDNRQHIKEDFVEDDAISSMVIKILNDIWGKNPDIEKYEVAPMEFYKLVTDMAARSGVNTNSRDWPGSANRFTLKLYERKDELAGSGYDFDGSYKTSGTRKYKFTKHTELKKVDRSYRQSEFWKEIMDDISDEATPSSK